MDVAFITSSIKVTHHLEVPDCKMSPSRGLLPHAHAARYKWSKGEEKAYGSGGAREAKIRRLADLTLQLSKQRGTAKPGKMDQSLSSVEGPPRDAEWASAFQRSSGSPSTRAACEGEVRVPSNSSQKATSTRDGTAKQISRNKKTRENGVLPNRCCIEMGMRRFLTHSSIGKRRGVSRGARFRYEGRTREG